MYPYKKFYKTLQNKYLLQIVNPVVGVFEQPLTGFNNALKGLYRTRDNDNKIDELPHSRVNVCVIAISAVCCDLDL